MKDQNDQLSNMQRLKEKYKRFYELRVEEEHWRQDNYLMIAKAIITYLPLGGHLGEKDATGRLKGAGLSV